MSAYRAFVVNCNSDGGVKREITMRNARNLPAGDLLIKVKYSSLNYFDVLSANGDKSITKLYPHTPGLDAAGIVAESSNDLFRKGDEVIVTGFGLGQDIPGGFGEYIRVPAEWAISLPTGLTLKDCMIIGTDGLAAAIAIMEINASGIPSSGNIIVSGAMSGTGAFATAILAKCGFKVTAVTESLESEDFLFKLGAEEILTFDKFKDHSNSQLLADKYIAGVDTAGGDALATVVKSVKRSGSISVCNMTQSRESTLSLFPLIFRGVNILGVDAINCPIGLRGEAWYKLAGEWYIKALPWLGTEIALSELDGYITRYLKNDIKGRIVINHEL